MRRAVTIVWAALFALAVACGGEQADKVGAKKDEGEITIKSVAGQTVAFWPRTGPFEQMPEAFEELAAWVNLNDLRIIGPPCALYFEDPSTLPPEKWRWEIQFPVMATKKISPDESGKGVKETSAINVASVIYQGPYDQVMPTYQRLTQWIGQNGYQIVGPSREVYLNDPSTTSPESLLTEIQFPVKRVRGK